MADEVSETEWLKQAMPAIATALGKMMVDEVLQMFDTEMLSSSGITIASSLNFRPQPPRTGPAVKITLTIEHPEEGDAADDDRIGVPPMRNPFTCPLCGVGQLPSTLRRAAVL